MALNEDITDYRTLPVSEHSPEGWYITDNHHIVGVYGMVNDRAGEMKLSFVRRELFSGEWQDGGITYVPETETVGSLMKSLIAKGDRLSYKMCDHSMSFSKRIEDSYAAGGREQRRMADEIARHFM